MHFIFYSILFLFIVLTYAAITSRLNKKSKCAHDWNDQENGDLKCTKCDRVIRLEHLHEKDEFASWEPIIFHQRHDQNMRNRVLIIEDEPVTAEMISMILEEQGFQVISLSDTSWARTKLHDQEVDLVLVDLKLKGEGGKSICKYIKRSNDLKNIPVILVSGNPDIQKVARDSGADGFIAKPFELNHFINKVQTFAQD